MNTELFIARRVAGSGRKSFARLIIRIAVVAVALSMSVMIVSSALIAGFKKEISSKVFGFWGHIHISDAQISNAFLDLSPISRNQPFYPGLDTVGPITYEEERSIAGLTWTRETTTYGGISHVQIYALKPGIIKSKSEIEGIILKGVGQDFDWSFVERYLQEGSALNWDTASPSRDIIISRQTADRLRVGVGDRFVVHFVERGEQLQRRFTVRGIYKTGLEEYDKVFALADIRQVQQILGWQEDQVGGFEVFLEDWRDLNVFVDYIYYDMISNELYAETIREKLPEIFEWLQLQDINEIVILVMMTIVALINMVTALLILILERTNMIGILKSLGASDWSIRKIFLYHAGFIVLWGLVLGNVIGIGLCVLQQQFRFIQLDEANYYLSEAPVDLQWLTVAGLNLGTLIVTLVFLILPSYLVARISPVKAIRFK